MSVKRFVLNSRVGADGLLHLAVPPTVAKANDEVQITIEPALSPTPLTQAEWRQFVLSTAGSISDPSFMRHEQGEYERREELP